MTTFRQTKMYGGGGGGYGMRSQEQHEKQMRSVFIGNIPYNCTDDELKEIFARVGTVVNFKYVLDRDTGKPRGYAFCEYADVQVAESAQRNLNGFELYGRTLRVDSAVNQGPGAGGGVSSAAVGPGSSMGGGRGGVSIAPPQSQDIDNLTQMAQPQAPQQVVPESPYGEAVDPAKAPEAISQAVASLPPEQMFELMKQMKICIQNNPNEARNMLLQNPQLAYALLQAQVVMRIIDPTVAMTMLHRDVPVTMDMVPFSTSMTTSQSFMHSQAQSMVAPIRQIAPMIAQPTDPRLQQQQQPQPTADEREKAELIRKVMELSDEQVELLPPDHKSSVMLLRQQLRAHGQI